MMKNILFICTLTALLSACSESRLFKKEEQYTPLCTYFNPLDLDIVHADDVSPLTLKYEFVMSMFELILKKRGGLRGL